MAQQTLNPFEGPYHGPRFPATRLKPWSQLPQARTLQAIPLPILPPPRPIPQHSSQTELFDICVGHGFQSMRYKRPFVRLGEVASPVGGSGSSVVVFPADRTHGVETGQAAPTTGSAYIPCTTYSQLRMECPTQCPLHLLPLPHTHRWGVISQYLY